MTIRYCILIIDIDGYCKKNIRQDKIITAHDDRYRPRELGTYNL